MRDRRRRRTTLIERVASKIAQCPISHSELYKGMGRDMTWQYIMSLLVGSYTPSQLSVLALEGFEAGTAGRTSLADIHGDNPWLNPNKSGKMLVIEIATTAVIAYLIDHPRFFESDASMEALAEEEHEWFAAQIDHFREQERNPAFREREDDLSVTDGEEDDWVSPEDMAQLFEQQEREQHEVLGYG